MPGNKRFRLRSSLDSCSTTLTLRSKIGDDDSSRDSTYDISFNGDEVNLEFTPSPALQLKVLEKVLLSTSAKERERSRRISMHHDDGTFPHLSDCISAHPPPAQCETRGRGFWLVFIAVCSAAFLEALDFTTVSTALPTIIKELKGSDKFVWVGAAYTLSSTVFQPLCGAFADIFGRRPCMIACLCFFAIGSAICGAAPNMEVLIAGRTVQGIGAAGIGSLSDIIVADLVPLKDRGTFTGILSAVWALAAAIGPSIGGAFAQHLSWRWLFYINIPLTSFSLLMVFFFANLKIPKPDVNVRKNLGRVDWLGNLIIITGSTLTIIALTWGGITYPWLSAHVLVPLIIGLSLTGFFFFYEKRWAKEPSVPFELLNNRTSLSGYLGTFFHGILATAIVYYLPLYFQGVKGHKPTRSGIDILELSLILSFVAVLSGVAVVILNCYRFQNWMGWVVSVAGFALLSLIKAETTGIELAALQVAVSVGIGIIYGVVMFPIMAPLGVTENAHALAFFMFVRTFSYTFGVTLGGAILQNTLTRKLPASFLVLLPPHSDIAYAALEFIPHLPPDQHKLIVEGFARSIGMVWTVLTGVAVAGLLSSLFMEEIPMSDQLDESYALEARQKEIDVEFPSTLDSGSRGKLLPDENHDLRGRPKGIDIGFALTLDNGILTNSKSSKSVPPIL